MAREADTDVAYFELKDFTFEDGTTVPTARVAYKILNQERTKVAVVHTCFRGRIHTTLTHADGALQKYKIIIIALFGNGESSSPSNTPGFAKRIEYQDCVNAQYRLLTEKLGIEEVDVMLGFSMGGQLTYRWITSHTKFVKNAVIVCSSAKTSRHNFQFLEGPKAALESAATPEQGIVAFGKAYSAWLTSAEWFDEELYQELGFQSLAAWDEVATRTGYDGWHGDDLLTMLRMWQHGDISQDCGVVRGDLRDVLNTIEARTLLMPCETDQYFRPYVSKREGGDIKNGRVQIIPSIWGHIAGGGASQDDTQWMAERIREFLRE
ncbi:Alpha/Beta hydrolase protein [Paraphoma chrysanthemicola]|uniref:Alpha/Beta hydrolase protein n=1 Tax=Paraphoma chrysanthemicola TaxID=798071 RepID=A0A8K0VRY4_9PLEO|nr:Alpha/Beta hydrolase protein [Paraphoma chrysanthemicola]